MPMCRNFNKVQKKLTLIKKNNSYLNRLNGEFRRIEIRTPLRAKVKAASQEE